MIAGRSVSKTRFTLARLVAELAVVWFCVSAQLHDERLRRASLGRPPNRQRLQGYETFVVALNGDSGE